MNEFLGGVNPREKKAIASDEREIDLANIFKKFSAFFSNSSLTSGGNNKNDKLNLTVGDNEEGKIKINIFFYKKKKLMIIMIYK